MEIEKQKILVVEDFDELRKAYSKIIERENFYVDTASNLEEALTFLDLKTYHVALVDIMLAGPYNDTNRDGLEVMAKIQELNEGTKIVALSAQKDPTVTRDILKKYGAEDYIDKKSLNKTSDLLDPIWNALSKCKLIKFGSYNDLFAFFAKDNNSIFWSDKAIRLLSPKNGIEGLKVFFNDLLYDFLPLIHPIYSADAFKIDEKNSTMHGKFWSKGQGYAIEFIVSRYEEDPISKKKWMNILDNEHELIHSISKSDLFGYVFKKPKEKKLYFVPEL